MAQTVESTSDQRTTNNAVRHTYRVLSDAEKAQMQQIKDMGAAFIAALHQMGGTDPAGERFASRDLSLDATHLDPAPPPVRVLIACEQSGVMRRAFAARGHDAWSCDLLPAEDGSNRHIRGDVRDHLADGWDLLIVAHPPCTRLCNSGARWLHTPPPGRTAAEMWAELDQGVDLFTACWRAPVARVAVENPVMHKHARERMPADLPRPQIVQPWWFGDQAFKATGFYLRGLPPLRSTNRLTTPRPGTDDHKRWSAVHRAPPGPDRWKFRSKTFAGVAEACADQWGGYAMDQIRRTA